MSDKKLSNYKSEFVYNAIDGNVVNVSVALSFDGENPEFTVKTGRDVAPEDMDKILDAMKTSILHKMDFDILENARIIIYNG